jgi:CheY-like chemotaxis protein
MLMGSPTAPAHILCINHAPEILGLLRTLLESEGYRVSSQTTVERDLDALVELAPDLITIDYMWATSDNEWTYLTMLRMDPRTRHIPIILCTGAVGHVLEMESHLTSIDVRVVFKPFDIEVFLKAVHETLDRAPDPATQKTSAED